MRNYVAFAALAAAVAFGSAAQAGPTLDAVKKNGVLSCGVSTGLAGFSLADSQGRYTGLDVDVCRMVAAAVLGDASKVKFVPLSSQQRFTAIQSGEVEILSRTTTWTLQRDTQLGLNFAPVVYYDGQGFMVPTSRNIVSAYQLDNLRLCVLDQSDQLANLQEFAFVNQATYSEVLYEDREDLAVAYSKGLCDAVSAPASWLNAIRRGMDDPGRQRILPERISKSVFGPVVRQGDDQWFKIVQWTLYLKKVAVCDTRLKERACPPGLR